MKKGVGRSYCRILLHACAHRNWNDPVVQGVGEELLSHVIFAVGVLKGEVELVVLLQHLHAVTISSGALEASAAPIDIHLSKSLLWFPILEYLDMFRQLSGVLQTAVPCIAV